VSTAAVLLVVSITQTCSVYFMLNMNQYSSVVPPFGILVLIAREVLSHERHPAICWPNCVPV
jgi:hypothetical protein